MRSLFSLICVILSPFSGLADDHGKHVFILSGQSNMQGHRPDEAFTPMVEKALDKEKVIVIQDALGGQPIHRWWKEWKNPKGRSQIKSVICMIV